jgi:hypothetical protein
MKRKILRLSLVLALVVAAVMAAGTMAIRPAAAGTIRIPIDNYNVNCTILSQTMWVEDGILHIRNRVMEGLVFSDSDTHTGTGSMVANANIDLATGYGNFWGTLEIYPDAYPEGHWAGSFSMQVNEGHSSGIARLQGYGELNGLSTKAALAPLTPGELASYAEACNCPVPPGPFPCPVSGANAVGFIMNPGDK